MDDRQRGERGAVFVICVYAPLASSTTGAGEAVLCPTSAKIRNVAGGEYSFTMTHPMDPWDKWRAIKRESIIRLPVPMEIIENAYTGQEADIYVTLDSCEMKEGTEEPEQYTFPYWDATAVYTVGSKVRDPGYGAYRCTYFDAASGASQIPPHNSSWWTKVADSSAGSPTVVTLNGGTELYLIEEVDETWLKLMTMYGVTGYLKRSQVRFDRHVDPEQVQPRIITEQLFRVKDVAVDHKNHEISVSGVHVSNDLSGNLIEDVEISQASLPMALTRIMDGLALDYPGEVATDMVGSTQTYTGSFKGKNGLFAFLDPDSGIVKKFGAKFTRDNWDLFIMTDTHRDTGFRLTYGNNVNGINWRTKSDHLITRILPVAKAEGGEDYYLPGKYVDAPNIDQYPVIYMETLRVNAQIGKPKSDDPNASNWTEAEVKTEMTTKANERFSVDKVNEPETEITVQLEMLGATADYPWLKEMQSVLLYDNVRVWDEDIGLDRTMTVTEIEYDCIKEKISGIKLSNAITSVARTVTGYNLSNASIGAEKLKDGVADGIIRAAVSMMPEYSDPTGKQKTLHHSDLTVTSISIASAGGYAAVGTLADFGITVNNYVTGFNIRGWSGAPGALSLVAASNGGTIYVMCSAAGTISSLTVRLWYY